ncbi:LysM peptidoglycan-binding domain-containing protein [Chungangia koreensis]|uniref:LysM peptidoglycan-binding domain-containing protein n=1 Tax=Chungangia koreensis TaxID=752657 RepID=A0ABV8X898_9LACT
MFKKMISIIPVAVLSVTVGANVQAATITVQQGDTLWNLSRENNTTVENIQSLNQLTSDLIHPGDVLTVSEEKNYTVKQGDTLWNIARDHAVTVSQIKEWNQLQSDLIHPNLNLVIFEGTPGDKTVPSVPVASKESAVPAAKAPTDNTSAVPAVSETKEKKNSSEQQAKTTNVAGAKEITVEATAYTASCEGCSGITATGINLKENPNARVISVDPSVIPLGSKVHVEGYGEAIAGDTGGAIKGNRIDVFIPNRQDAINFGRKQLKVTILD